MVDAPSKFSERRKTVYVASLLGLITVLLYWRTVGYEFIVVDDHQYVFKNAMVLKGISWEGIKWAFTAIYAANWHPITWISHMVDESVYGLFAGGHHLTNVFFHTANAILLFLVLKRMTAQFWPSAFVAALFAWHPAHVESVAWVCERKDILSTFFMVLTLWAYNRYTTGPTAGKYIWTLVFFALGLMAKPMLVTMPCVLLLLDYWPLNRFAHSPKGSESSASGVGWGKLIVEKIPFFLLSLLSCAVTVVAQHAGGAINTLERVSLSFRLVNAISSYGAYLDKAIWPVHLSVFYPLPTTPPWGLFAFSIVVLILVTCIVFRLRLSAPCLIVGWLWFLGTLVPVIGLVQVGSQAMADRYTYIPYIGLFVMLAWSADGCLQRRSAIRPLVVGTASLILVVCAVLSELQLSYWHDSIRLFTHALAVTESSVFCEKNLSYALSEAGRGREAIPHYEALLRLTPKDNKVRYNFGLELMSAGEPAQAELQFSEVIKEDPESDKAHNSLGTALFQQGKLNLAGAEFEKAIQLNPQFSWPCLNYAVVLQTQGLAGPAITNYAKAVELQPGWTEALDKLAFLLATCPEAPWHDPARAVKLATQANELTDRKSPYLLDTLAVAYAAQGVFSNAVATAELAQKEAQSAGLQPLAAKLQNDIESYRTEKIVPVDWKTPRVSVIVRH
ncbi:MAG TPA: tetratricopeptide repeat protein [Verrucomicrobiae bacterium]|jgi:tetratricopeptide (TPR) repeat protein|nr:tetratricopeptide repeat protein [Verrucomicrobiae bacterium]